MINESIYEDGNGGQLLLQNNDIGQTESLATLAYLKMFGGNKASSTTKDNVVNELSTDWWGNYKTDPSDKWINSETERLLQGLALTSGSRIDLENAVKRDLKSLEQYGKIEVTVTFPRINTVKIDIVIIEPSRKNSTRLVLIWDATRKEMIEQILL